jgi:hypothetical protein
MVKQRNSSSVRSYSTITNTTNTPAESVIHLRLSDLDISTLPLTILLIFLLGVLHPNPNPILLFNSNLLLPLLLHLLLLH